MDTNDPDYELPEEYKSVLSGIDHADIVLSTCEDEELLKNADVVVFDSWASIDTFPIQNKQSYVIRTTFEDLFVNQAFLNMLIRKASRINLAITDIHRLTSDIESYIQFLENLSEKVFKEYKDNHGVQVNILTDRILLDKMNNCGAGDETITLAPNGKFYICPAFYFDDENDSVGNISEGLQIKNSQLYKLAYAPICRNCDAYHCRRCIWLNRKTTLEVNTPSHEQCVVSHIERNAARELLEAIRKYGEFLPSTVIKEIAYLDPFENLLK